MRKKPAALLQNLALAALTVSALYLLSLTPLFSGSWSDRVQAIFAAGPPAGGEDQGADLGELIQTVRGVGYTLSEAQP